MPVHDDLRNRRDALSSERRVLLERRMRQAARVSSDGLTIVPRPSNVPALLSFAQQRLWFLQQFEPESIVYNDASGVVLSGEIDLAIFVRAIRAILQRHEVMCAIFPMVDDVPMQVPHPELPATMVFPHLDLTALPASTHHAFVHAYAHVLARRPFDLTCELAWKVSIVRLARDEHVFLCVYHHIISDRWSLTIFMRELTALYQALLEGRSSPLADLPIQYADFAAWQRGWLTGANREAQLAYWAERLTGAPPLLALPTDRVRPPVASAMAQVYPLVLAAGLCQQVQRFSRQEGVTPFMVLLAAYVVVLARYSQQWDVVVGVPIAGRTQPELEDLVGCFINLLVIRTDLSDQPSGRVLVQRVRQVMLEAHAHQDLPFEQIVEMLQPDRDAGYPPVVQVAFSFQNVPPTVFSLAGLRVEDLNLGFASARFDVNVQLFDRGATFEGVVEYASDLFDAATIARFGDHYQTVLAALVGSPAQCVMCLPLLTGVEWEQVVGDWGVTLGGGGLPEDVDGAVFARAAEVPDVVALVCADQHVTYQALVAGAQRLAVLLQEAGVGPEQCVALYLERSVTMVMALLGVLVAGAAYLPLDPLYPLHRRAFILRDSGAMWVLTHSAWVGSLPETQARVFLLDRVWDAWCDGPLVPFVARSLPDMLAYVLYTSGSTGVPKGVAISRRAFACFMAHMQGALGLGRDDRLLAVTTLAFDIAALELFLPLMVGACVVVAPQVVTGDGQALLALLDAARVSFMQATPATWRLLVAAGWVGRPLLTVLCGGEALPLDLAGELVARGGCVWNLYGPTETTIWSCQSQVVAGGASVSIGRPIAYTQAYVLDSLMQPVPIGVPGELYLGGLGVARGYLHRPDLTAERFVPNPFRGEGARHGGQHVVPDRGDGVVPSLRLYRTGDLVRWQADGQLAFMGRMDTQVKVRGFRIELGEIEAALREQPLIRDAVVVLRADVPGDARFVAYIVGADEGGVLADEVGDAAVVPTLTPVQVRAFLSERLPSYMIPSGFVFLAGLPLTPNGKVDRQALPAPQLSDRWGKQYVAPRTPIECALVEVWQQVLGKEGIGVQDHFFALGGHSFLAMQCINRIRALFRVEVPMRLLFEAPTVAALGVHVARLMAMARVSALPPLRALPRDRMFPLSVSQERMWMLDAIDRDRIAFNLSAALRLRGRLDVSRLRRSFTALVARHEALRTRLVVRAGGVEQQVLPAFGHALPLIDLRGVEGGVREVLVRRLATDDAQRRFDLQGDLLFCTSLLRLGVDEHVLLINTHHIIADGWSLNVLYRDLVLFYNAFVVGEVPALAPLPIQYADFTTWIRTWLQGAVLDAELAYWRQKLDGAPALFGVRTTAGAQSAAREEVVFNAAFRAGVQAICERADVTLFTVLLAVLAVVIARQSGQGDVVIGVSAANRAYPETVGIIGFFANTLIVRVDLADDPPFEEVVRRVQLEYVAALDHQDVTIEQVLSLFGYEHVDVLFNFMPRDELPTSAPGWQGLTIDEIATEPLPMYQHPHVVLVIQDWPDALRGAWMYHTAVLDAPTVARMVAEFDAIVVRAGGEEGV